jgi:hypothetical protein
MHRPILIGCFALLLATFAFGSTLAAACGWDDCDDYGHYGSPAYAYYAAPVSSYAYYAAPPVYYVLPPAYAYAPAAYYNQPYFTAYYGRPRSYAPTPYYYAAQMGYVSAGYYGARRYASAGYYGVRRGYRRVTYNGARVGHVGRRW